MSSVYYIICIALILCAVIGTLMVAFSKENKEGNPGYYKKSGRNWFLLTSFYILASIGLVFLLVFAIN